MKFAPLSAHEAALVDATHVCEIDHTDLTQATAATAQTIALFSVTANQHNVECVRFELLVPFQDTADAANNTNTVEIGDGGDTDRLLTATQVNVNGTEVYNKSGTGTKFVSTSDDTIDATFAAPTTGKTLLALNRGLLRLYFRISDRRDSL